MSSRSPGPGRLRAARAAGLRPRSRWLPLALIALALALAVPSTLEGPAAWLARQLGDAFDPGAFDRLRLPRPGLALALVLAVLLAALLAALIASQGARPRADSLRPGVDARRLEIPIAIRIALTLAGSMLALWLLAPVLAAAARSVDASPASLASVWLIWLGRALWIVAGCAGLLAAIELWVSGRQLVRALHLSPEQERELSQTRSRSR